MFQTYNLVLHNQRLCGLTPLHSTDLNSCFNFNVDQGEFINVPKKVSASYLPEDLDAWIIACERVEELTSTECPLHLPFKQL